ncbi:hypothetical protein [Agromyces italicus]|uniref:hypothetical protein n=1 Tax=Agromyces italicus TaxID=279572 RepID=UPI0003B5A7A0|nr:hypothetical protein [Agromyces italicus]
MTVESEGAVPQLHEPVELWTDDAGTPLRLVWRSRRFRVSDTPTALVGACEWWRPFAEHDVSPGRLPLEISGWRFQAGTADGETHVFDVEHASGSDARWHVVRVFD